jgi:hypothetical protein
MARRRRAHHDPFAPRRFEPFEPPTAPEAMARRRRSNFTPTPAMFVQRDEDEQRIVGREPFPMQRPQGMQGYGDPSEMHTAKGEVAADEASRKAREAAEEAIAGECEHATQLLFSAHGHLGAAVAHSGAGGRVTIGHVSSTVEKAGHYVSKYCKVVNRRRR